MEGGERFTPNHSFLEIHEKVMSLKQFVLGTGKADFPHPIRPEECAVQPVIGEAFDMPPTAGGGADLLDINNSGSVLLEALDDPELTHDALDGLLALETVRRYDEGLGDAISAPIREVDENGAQYFDKIIAGNDKLAAMKALSLVYGRHDAGRSTHANIERYWPYVIQYSDSAGRTAESVTFYKNLLQVMSSSTTSLFGSFVRSLGYEEPYKLKDTWLETRPEGPLSSLMMEGDRSRANIRSMINLERIEPGLCKKITETFNIINFARYDSKMLVEMYRSRVEEPDRPYVLSMSARADHNGALGSYREIGSKPKMQKKLARKGIRYEEHECEDRGDVENLIEKALELRSSHGSDIKDFIIHAHGSPNQINLGDDNGLDWNRNNDNTLRTGRIDYLTDLSPVLCKGARVILRSCSSGQEKDGSFSIARDISTKLGRDVVAPRLDVASRVSVHNRLGRTRIEPRFIAVKYILMASPLFLIPKLGEKAAVNLSHSRVKRVYSPNTLTK